MQDNIYEVIQSGGKITPEAFNAELARLDKRLTELESEPQRERKGQSIMQVLDGVCRAVQTSTSLDFLKDTQAKAVRVYAKLIGDSLEVQNKAAEIRIRAMRRAGQILKAMQESGELRSAGGQKGNKNALKKTKVAR